ncbi:hypothetical protein RYX36_012165 [Vicia faba]
MFLTHHLPVLFVTDLLQLLIHSILISLLKISMDNMNMNNSICENRSFKVYLLENSSVLLQFFNQVCLMEKVDKYDDFCRERMMMKIRIEKERNYRGFR